jgi:hypothetical protein
MQQRRPCLWSKWPCPIFSPLPLCPAVSFTLVSLLLPPSYSLAKPQLLPVESFIHLFIQVWRASLYRLVLHLDRPCIIYNVSKAKNRIIFSGPSHPTGHMGLDYWATKCFPSPWWSLFFKSVAKVLSFVKKRIELTWWSRLNPISCSIWRCLWNSDFYLVLGPTFGYWQLTMATS